VDLLRLNKEYYLSWPLELLGVHVLEQFGDEPWDFGDFDFEVGVELEDLIEVFDKHGVCFFREHGGYNFRVFFCEEEYL
jgi:hypothetical protein